MMESVLKRIERNRKERERWIALVLCLSMIVSLGVFSGLRMDAIAKTYTKKVLDCPYALEGAERVAHTHNTDCYDEHGVLVCTLPELEAHTHSDACYLENVTLVCGLEENPGHVHSADCYAPETTLACNLEENEGHQHTADCYTLERGDLICENADEDHEHTDACFAWNEVLSCGMEAGEGSHMHSEDCYRTEWILTCGLEEGEGAHTHTDACFETEQILVCDREELPVHVHDAGCFRTEEITVEDEQEEQADDTTEPVTPEMPVGDPYVDLETAEDWERDFDDLELSGNWAADLITVAVTQQGRGESSRNFTATLNDAGDAWTTNGYTRYGAWYGSPYAEWSAMFVSFCLRYAGIPEANVPNNPTPALMAETFIRGELFAGTDYTPAPGDLIFFDSDEEPGIDHMGIVYSVDAETGTVSAIEGDRTNVVELFGYYLDDEEIAGYGILPQNLEFNPAENTETSGEIEYTDTESEVSAVVMPAQSFEQFAGGIKVSVEAPEGAFPEGTVMTVTPVNGNSLKDTVSDAVDGEILEVQAVDITFSDAEGKEIEPATAIRVSITPVRSQNAQETTSVVHIDSEGAATPVDQAAGTEEDNKEVVFDADAFSIYAIVYSVHFEYEVNGQVYTASVPGAQNKLLSELIQELNVVSEEQFGDFMGKIAEVRISNPEVLRLTENEGDWSLFPLKKSEQEEALTIVMQDGASFSITVMTEGITEVRTEDETAVISTVNERYLPAEASAHAEMMDVEQSESVISAVQQAAEPAGEQDSENAEKTVDPGTRYQAFSIGLENVDVETYDGFNVSVALPEDEVVGRDFQLFQVKEDGSTTELTGTLELTSEKDEDGLRNVSGFSFTTDEFAEYVLSYSIETFYTTYEGESLRISLKYGPKAGIPEGAELEVREILPEDEQYEGYLSESTEKLRVESSAVAFARFLDIEIRKDGEKIEPQAPVSVKIEMLNLPEETENAEAQVIHFGEQTEVLETETAGTDVSFETGSFSVYGVVYTVDFHYEIDGKEYEFSLPGGGFISMEHLFEVLGILNNDESSDYDAQNDDVGGENLETDAENDVANVEKAAETEETSVSADSENEAANTDISTAYEQTINLNNVPVSEATRAFVADVEAMEFSSPELVWVGKVEEESTVGALKEANGLEVEYSANLTEEQVAEINAQTVEAGDWALISILPFKTEETLTVTMKNGEIIVIHVTDARDPLGLDGRTFAIVTIKNGTDGHSLQAGVHTNKDNRGYYLESLGININDGTQYEKKDGIEYVRESATAWKFEYNAEAQAYYVSSNGKYLYIDPQISSKIDSQDHSLNLVDNKSDGTLIKITRDENGNFLFGNQQGTLLWDYGGGYWLSNPENDNESENEQKSAQVHLCLPENPNGSHKASLISAADTQPGQKIVVYQRIWVTGTDGQPTAEYYAVDGNGRLVKVTNSSDAIYWKGDQTIEWTLKEVGSGYYTLYNEQTGKYLVPKSNGIVHSADEAAFAGDAKHLSISLTGRDEGKYRSTISSWDYNANVTYGMTATTSAVGPIQLLNSQEFYFAARDPIVHNQLTTVDTVNSLGDGIKITMYDWGDPRGADAHRQFWDQNGNDPSAFNYGNTQSIPLQDRLKMMQDIMGSSSDDYRVGQVTRNILANYIAEGQEAPDILTNSGHNLSELFSDEYIKGGSANKEQFNNLFLQSVYDETGFYKYSCFENYAYLPNGSTDFTVYEQIGTPSNRVNDQYNSTNINFARGQFMPYNPIGTSMEYRLNERDPDLAALDSNDPRFHERVYYIQNENAPSGTYNVGDVPDYIHNYNSTMTNSNNPETYANYFFGMKMEAKFTQEPGGIAKNGDPMVYEFNGDDDLWVYIDGVLVLDLGGVHDAFRGKINFQNGKVTCNASNGQDTTIKEMFRQAHRYPDGSEWPEGDNSRVDEFFTGDTFKDNSTHEFTMFYMERGASASNLDMQFNLTVLNQSQFRVKKEMPETQTGQAIQGNYANAAFYYEAYVEDANVEGGYAKVTREYLTSKGLGMPKYEDGSTVVWKSDNAGETIFEVKPGDTAIFPATDDTVKWYVVEVEPEAGSQMLSNYRVSNSDPDPAVSDGTKSLIKKIKNRNIVTFQNRPDDKLVNELQIKKQINGTAYHETDAFEYRIFLEDTDNNLVAYNFGEYYQIDSKGRYVYFDGGVRKIQSENPDGPYTYVDLDGTTVTDSLVPRIAEHASVNGSLANVQDGDTIIIKGLLEGTDFYVYERTDFNYMAKDDKTVENKYVFEGTEVTDAYTRNPETNKPDYPVGELYDQPDAAQVLEKYNTTEYEQAHAATGAIIQNKDAKVLVKNKPFSPDLKIKVEKQWEGIENPITNEVLADSSVTVTLGRYVVTDKAGNFSICKQITVDQGSASDTGFSAKYFIRGTDAAGNSQEFGPYIINGDGVATGSIPPGIYKVYEEIISADGSYSWTHHSDPVDLVITDGENGNPNPVTFTSEAIVKTGSLWIKSTLDAGGSGETFSSVNYIVYESDGVTRAKYPNGTEIPVIPFSEANTVNTTGGKKLEGLKTGRYVVKESTLPEVDGYVITEHVPVNSDRVSVMVVENSEQAEAVFSTKYEEASSGSTYKIGKPDSWNADSVTGDIDYPVGTDIVVTFKGKNWGYDRIDNLKNQIPNPVTYNGQPVGYTTEAADNWNTTVYKITLKVVKDAVLRVNINGSTTGDNPEVYDISITSVPSRGSAPGRMMKMPAVPIRSINPGTESPTPETYGNEPSDPLKNYTDDATFRDPVDNTKPFTLTLDQSNKWKWQSELPVSDDDGNKYYYYIKEIVETNMPTGTTCEVQLDNGSKYLVGYGLHVDEDGNPLPLVVKNTVIDQPDLGSLQITKNILKNGTPDTEATGTFYYAVYEEAYNPDAESVQTPLRKGSITITENGTNTVTEDELPLATYYVYELDKENGTPVVSTTNGTVETINHVVYTVTGSGTSVTVTAEGVQVSLNNNHLETTVTLKKVDVNDVGDDNAELLQGATFTVTRYTDSNFNHIDQEAPYTQTKADTKNGDVYIFNGIFEFTGLSIGFYRVDESVLPAGYVKTGADPVFEVRQKSGTTNELEVVLYQKKADGTYEEVGMGATVMVRVTSGNTIVVGNTPGTALPQTGGIGTNLFTVIGGILSATAGAILTLTSYRRRKRQYS